MPSREACLWRFVHLFRQILCSINRFNMTTTKATATATTAASTPVHISDFNIFHRKVRQKTKAKKMTNCSGFFFISALIGVVGWLVQIWYSPPHLKFKNKGDCSERRKSNNNVIPFLRKSVKTFFVAKKYPRNFFCLTSMFQENMNLWQRKAENLRNIKRTDRTLSY